MGTYGRTILGTELGNINLSKVITLNKKIKRKLQELKRVEHKWDIIMERAFFLEDVIESQHSIDWKIRSSFNVEKERKCKDFLDVAEWLWYIKIQPPFLMFVGCISILFSLMIVLGEILIFTDLNKHLISGIVNTNQGYVIAQV